MNFAYYYTFKFIKLLNAEFKGVIRYLFSDSYTSFFVFPLQLQTRIASIIALQIIK